MSYSNEILKLSRFDTLMYSDPEHVVFSYSQQAKYLRLLQLEKWTNTDENTGQRDYFQESFHLRDLNNSEGDNNLSFIPKRCFVLDDQLTVIQKKQEGKPINYLKALKKQIDQKLSQKVFRWYSDNEQIVFGNNSQFFKQYYFYPEIKSFCFGRKHFVRALNSIELSSDHISRNHCELVIKKGKTEQDMENYFQLLFGLRVGLRNKRVINEIKREKISKGNLIQRVTKQLWQIIYSYIFLSEDKYYLLDNGSRNGTFFIECFGVQEQLRKNTQKIEYDYYGHKIIRNHELLIKQGYSYEFQGEEYLMKVWRLTQSKQRALESDELNQVKLQKINSLNSQESNQISNRKSRNSFDQNNGKKIGYENEYFSLNVHNQKSIRYIQEFQDKINWFNNFQKVSKEYVIDESLLKKSKWKNKKVYQEMISKGVKKQQNLNLPNQRIDSEMFQGPEQLVRQNQQRVNQDQQQSPHTQNNASELITKQQFVKLIYKEFLLQQKALKQYYHHYSEPSQHLIGNLKQSVNNGESQKLIPQKQHNLFVSDLSQFNGLFINLYQINTIVISLDFSNDFKKLYCIITQTNKPNKFHLGSQMVINTARFEFEEYQKCNGYIQFDGKQWKLISLSSKNPHQQNHQKNHNIHSNQILSEDQSDIQSFKTTNKQSKTTQNPTVQNKFAKKSNKIEQNHREKQKLHYKFNFSKKLSNKIWTKIPATSLYELKPKKCSNYLIRLAHSFYFQLKFFNFKNKHNELEYQNQENQAIQSN